MSVSEQERPRRRAKRSEKVQRLRQQAAANIQSADLALEAELWDEAAEHYDAAALALRSLSKAQRA